MYDSPVAVFGQPLQTEAEQTTQLCLPDTWRWPDRDPDPLPDDVIAEAPTALHRCDEPTLPILKSVLNGLSKFAP